MSTEVIQLITAGGVLATMAGVVKIIFMFGRTYERLDALEHRVEMIDREGCRRIAKCEE